MKQPLKYLLAGAAICLSATAANACVELGSKNSSYRFFNNCKYDVVVRYFASGGPFLSSAGLTGRIPVGDSTIVPVSTEYRIRSAYCDYDEWIHNNCDLRKLKGF